MRFLSNLLASTLGALLALGLVFLFGLLFLFALVASADQTPSVRSGSVLVLELDGALPELSADDPFASALGSAPSADLPDVKGALRKAAADDRVEAVWLRLGTLASPWATLQEVRDALVAFRESGKPLYASSTTYAMSEAEYFVASAADSVFGAPQGLFEFNGFYLNAEFYKRLLDRLEVEPQVVRAGRFKAAVEPFLREDLSPENRAQLDALLAAQNEVFLEAVARDRRSTPEALARLASEQGVFSMAQARQAGLLDALLFDDQIEALLRRHTGQEEGDALRTVSLKAYARVPAKEAGVGPEADGEVAVVYAVGAIAPGESGFSANPLFGGDVVGAETFARAMRTARESDRVKAVVLRINSPGGYAPAAEAMRREIERTRATKPVVVSMGDYAASGGYWIAAPADTIVAQPLTLTGSIGVFSLFFDAGGLFEDKIGITFDAVRTSPYADMFSGVRPLSPAEEALLQASIDETYQDFLSLVAKHRGLPIAQVDSLGQGRVWSGVQARQIGLVDVLGGLDTAIALAAERAGLEGRPRLRLLPRPKTFLEQITDQMSSSAHAAWLALRTSEAERALLAQARQLRELAQLQATAQARLPSLFTIR